MLQIVAGGNILVSDTLQMYSRNKLFSVALSREMAPSARIVAYFVAYDSQVVADSLNFYVNGSRLHEVSSLLNYILCRYSVISMSVTLVDTCSYYTLDGCLSA